MKKTTVYWISGILIAIGAGIALYFALRKENATRMGTAAKPAPARVAAIVPLITPAAPALAITKPTQTSGGTALIKATPTLLTDGEDNM